MSPVHMRAARLACRFPRSRACTAAILIALPWACQSKLQQSSEPATAASGSHGEVSRQPVAPLPLVAGDHHTCAVDAAGQVWCWGYNSHGQLGDGTLLLRPRPVRVPLIRGAVALRAGKRYTCATLDEGSEHCWGNNQDGSIVTYDLSSEHAAEVEDSPFDGDVRLGITMRVTPGQIVLPQPLVRSVRAAPGADTHTQAAAVVTVRGVAHTCERRVDQSIWCWGSNRLGQHGNGQGGPREQPELVRGLPPARAIAAGADRTCALTRAGEAWCWGSGHSVPVHVTLPEAGAALAVDEGSTCVASVSGAVYCWTAREPAAPVRIAGVTKAVRVGVAGFYACAQVKSGAVWCWRREDPEDSEIPVVAPWRMRGFQSVVDIVVGYSENSALERSGQWKAWHWPVEVEVKQDLIGLRASAWRGQPPVARPLGNGSVLTPRCAITRAGGVLCADMAEPGDQPPVYAPAYDLAGIIALAAHGDSDGGHMCGLRKDGRVLCWGARHAHYATDDLEPIDATPDYGEVAMDMGMSGIVAIAAGRAHVCGVNNEGEVLCRGDNQHGQLGLGIPLESAEPVMVELRSNEGRGSSGGGHQPAHGAPPGLGTNSR
jgi:alpha-tubulin suppressor-like RCC1 family protein